MNSDIIYEIAKYNFLNWHKLRIVCKQFNQFCKTKHGKESYYSSFRLMKYRFTEEILFNIANYCLGGILKNIMFESYDILEILDINIKENKLILKKPKYKYTIFLETYDIQEKQLKIIEESEYLLNKTKNKNLLYIIELFLPNKCDNIINDLRTIQYKIQND